MTEIENVRRYIETYPYPREWNPDDLRMIRAAVRTQEGHDLLDQWQERWLADCRRAYDAAERDEQRWRRHHREIRRQRAANKAQAHKTRLREMRKAVLVNYREAA